MAFTAILRKSGSILIPLATRLDKGGQRNHHTALFTALSHQVNLAHKKSSLAVPFLQQFSSSAVTDTQKPSSNDSLLRVLESEIEVAQESEDHDRVEETPQGFPFKVRDNPGQQTVILTRDYESELVKVEVHMPDLVTGEDNDVGDDNDDTEHPTQSTLPLVVTVTKKSGTCLEFHCVAYADSIAIDSLSIRVPETSEDQMDYEGPNFHDLDENLRKAFHKFLEIRGIKPSTTNFLHEYMINKDSREYVGWLNNLKKFIEA